MSDTRTSEPVTRPSSTSKLVSASALMAAGTLTSRVLGFGRLMLLVLLFGNGTRQADMFTFANTVPNSMYILLAGGVLNTVLVPQIVRAVKNDPDGGEAYTNRIMTAGLLILGAITVALTFAAPLVIGLYTPGGWHTPARAAQYDSMVMLAYYCLPQIFFYGVHVLAGQVLNARDRFGPMMWAPIANNVISILVLLIFLVVFGEGDRVSAFTSGQELLLGLGSTLGIAAQAAVLVPFLRSAGYRFQPRFDFRHTGLGHTFRLAKWTLGFVLTTQAALVVVYRLAGSATAGGRGAGLTVYSNAYAVWILPHSLITLSLATVMLPTASRLAAAGDLAGVRDETMRTMRLAVTALLPTAVALVALGQPVAQLAFGFGRGAADAHLVGWALMALALGLVPFTVQYVCLRAYYSLEDTRTTFFLQLLISGVHVVLALSVVALIDQPSLVATGLALAYAGAYSIGVVVSFRVLGRRLPGLDGRGLLRHCLRLLVAVLPAGIAAYLLSSALTSWSPSRAVLLLALVSAGVVAVPLFLLMARLLRISEVTDIVGTFVRRRSPAAPAGATAPLTLVLALSVTRAVSLIRGSRRFRRPDGRRVSYHRCSTERHAELQSRQSGRPGWSDGEHTVHGEPARRDRHSGGRACRGDAGSLAAVMPAGTVLAQRYRLEELLADSLPTVTWRAFDQVLSRSVLVHLLPPRDPGAADLLAAARNASVATDSRFLRVLDAVYSNHPELGSYIVCEYATGQSLERILSQGPLSGLEAAWVVREVADALSGVHAYGLYHRRINPDSVIVTPTGNVKIVGLMIEAALKPNRTPVVHGATTPELVDVLDLGRLLYATLVARWPGGPAFGLPDAPVLGRRWMTPRQVRAGVSPSLDVICDQILGAPPRHRAPQLTTANDVVNALTKVLGTADASGDLERRLRQPVPRVGGPRTAPVSSLLDQSDPDQTHRQTVPRPGASAFEAEDLGQRTEQMAAADLPRRPVAAANAPPPGAPHGSVSAYSSGAASAQTTLIRQPAPPSSPPRTPRRRPGSAAVPTPGRRRRWVGLVVLLAVALVVAGLVTALVLNRRTTTAAPDQKPAPPTSASSVSPTASNPIEIATARDFDPQGDDQRENPDRVKFAYDDSTKTRWQTVTYLRNPKLGGIKRGVGLVLDLGQPQPVGTVKVSLSGSGTAVQLRVPKEDPATITEPPMSSDSRWQTVSKQSKAKKTATLEPEEPVTTRFVLVYLTSLPKEGSGYRGGIYDVRVFS